MPTAAWTRKEGKSKSGGLNAKGVASYRAANPGSKLKTAVTTKPSKLKKGSKAANRRKSFNMNIVVYKIIVAIDELIEKVKTMDSFSIFLSLILFTWILFMFTFTKEPFNAG